MLFFEVIKNIFRFTPEPDNNDKPDLTKTLATLEAEKSFTSRELEVLRSRVSHLERYNSNLWSQVTEKEKRLGEANTEIAVIKQVKDSLQEQNISLLSEVGEKTSALLEARNDSAVAKNNEAGLRKECEDLKMQKQELEGRNNNDEMKIKIEPGVNIKLEPETEGRVGDNYQVKVEFNHGSAEVDQRPRCLSVFGLSPFTKERDLAKEFGFGSLERVTIVRDRNTGRSKGYGFVKYTDPDDAELARGVMNNTQMNWPYGRRIHVDFAYSETPTFDHNDHNPYDLRTKRVCNRRGTRTYSTKRYKPYSYY